MGKPGRALIILGVLLLIILGSSVVRSQDSFIAGGVGAGVLKSGGQAIAGALELASVEPSTTNRARGPRVF